MKFRNLKLGTKQMIGFGLILFVMAGVNIFSINKMATIKSEIDEVTANWLPRAIAIADINLNTANLRRSQLQHAFAKDLSTRQDQASNMISLIARIDANRNTYEELRTLSEESNLYSEQERQLYSEFDKKWEDYLDLSFIFLGLLRENENAKAVALLNADAQTVFNELSEYLVELVSVNKEDAFAAAKRAESTFLSTRNIFRFLLIVTIFLSVIIAVTLVRLMTIPLKQLVEAAGNVARGNLDVQLNIQSQDEIGDLALSFNQMTVALRDAREREREEAKLRAEAAELRAKAKEAEAKALKAENLRKTHELEEARKLQLAMLPDEVPQISNLDISAYMRPATEVGGDYYDFKTDDDGTLTVAIGDAAGHGTKAGIMVAAVKGLFEVLASQGNILHIFEKITVALRAMNLGGKMFMAMTVVKIKDYKMKLAAAGMPLPLVWRAATENVETIELKGMPLGSFEKFPYRQVEIDLQPGDTVVLMSDGLPELFNPEGETLDYPTLAKLVAESDDKTPYGLIQFLTKSGEEWANGRPPDDDMTFVALQAR